jgi:hypothetical protein
MFQLVSINFWLCACFATIKAERIFAGQILKSNFTPPAGGQVFTFYFELVSKPTTGVLNPKISEHP